MIRKVSKLTEFITIEFNGRRFSRRKRINTDKCCRQVQQVVDGQLQLAQSVFSVEV